MIDITIGISLFGFITENRYSEHCIRWKKRIINVKLVDGLVRKHHWHYDQVSIVMLKLMAKRKKSKRIQPLSKYFWISFFLNRQFPCHKVFGLNIEARQFFGIHLKSLTLTLFFFIKKSTWYFDSVPVMLNLDRIYVKFTENIRVFVMTRGISILFFYSLYLN